MEINDLSPMVTYPLGALFLFAMVALVLGVIRVHKLEQKILAENDREADKMVSGIMEQIGWETKPLVQVTPDELEYVSVLLKNFRMGRNTAWVRVRVSKTNIRANIEYWWDMDYIERLWIEQVARHFEKRGAQVTIRSAERQPYPEEIYISKQPVRNEADNPDPLSD
jgi:hypothetical protein